MRWIALLSEFGNQGARHVELSLREFGRFDERMQMCHQLGENFSGPSVFCTLHLLQNKGGQFLRAIKHFEVVTLWVG